MAIACLLLGGITALPWLVALLLDRLAPLVARRALPLLAVERARRELRESAAVAVSGVVASLSLAVALTVMVASFRDSVTQWLDHMLPADLYVRSAGGLGASDTVYFTPRVCAWRRNSPVCSACRPSASWRCCSTPRERRWRGCAGTIRPGAQPAAGG